MRGGQSIAGLCPPEVKVRPMSTQYGIEDLRQRNFDAVVIGSGVGGICAATLLACNGFGVLLAEKRKYLGRRFCTFNHDGFPCATGDLAVPIGYHLGQCG